MKIGGFQAFSLSDYPGMTAAIIFTQGCNFRCPFCHNGSLIPCADADAFCMQESRILSYLRGRRGLLDGVVVTGGEPTIQENLPLFLRRIRELDFSIKLDTNGSRPAVLRRLLDERLVDYIAMDVKAPPDRYDQLSGVSVSVQSVGRSIELIGRSGIPHEFRTTVVTPLLSEDDIRSIGEMIPDGSPHILQTFNPENVFDPALVRFTPAPGGVEAAGGRSA